MHPTRARSIFLGLCFASFGACGGPEPEELFPGFSPDEREAESRPRGLVVRRPEAVPGYVLFSPLMSDIVYLIDSEGLVVHTWKTAHAPQGWVYLTEAGRLLRGARVNSAVFKGGTGGRLEEYTWDGELVWSFAFPEEQYFAHHDVEPLPNGNVLAITWERISAEEARRLGRNPDRVPVQGVWPLAIFELEPAPPEGARVVWEWHARDHLIQNVDETLPNFGDPAAHPERIDVNGDAESPIFDERELERLKALGYVSRDANEGDLSSDLFHTNAIAYNAELDQIALSTNFFSEIWILDHSATTEQAAGSVGGRQGKGGDLLYRWGNPSAYGRQQDAPRRLFNPHDVRWIAEGLPGAGHLTIFNNNVPGPREGEQHSAVVEIAPPVDDQGAYVVPETGPFGPAEPVWTYVANDRTSFYSSFISGATRLANGNTLICQGADGRFFEVTPGGKIVWEYWSAYSGNARMADGSDPHPVQENTAYAVFRATKLPPEHPGLAGRDLTPLDPQPPPVKRRPAPELEPRLR